MKIEIQYQERIDAEAISLEKYYALKERRRRRVAKRLAKKMPMFAVEEMQAEFPGYTRDQFEKDIQQKKKTKKKSIRHVKTYRFNFDLIRQETPELWAAAKRMTPTKIVLRLRWKETTARVTISSKYYDDGCLVKFDTFTLIRLWRGPVQKLLAHPAVSVQQENNTMQI